YFFFSSRRRHTRSTRDWSSDVCSSDLASAVRQPLRHRIDVPLRPRTLLAFAKQLANALVLIPDRLLRIDGDEIENERQGFVLANDALDEAVVALDWVVEVGDVSSRLVKIRGAHGSHPPAGGVRRDRKV